MMKMIEEEGVDQEINWARKTRREALDRKDITDEKWCQGYLDALNWIKTRLLEKI